jgi:acyl-CoA synthetase (AMP-forming)/AMP-acid ligase II/acyl carrier protein
LKVNKNITDCLYEYALSKPDDVAFRFLSDSYSPDELTFKNLWLDSYAIAEFLNNNTSLGDRVLLLYPSSLEYIKAFYGCLIAGVVAVPLYPPRNNKKSDRILKVAESCQANVALTTTKDLPIIKKRCQKENDLGLNLTFYSTDGVISESNDIKVGGSIVADAPAFLQYTSGSTGSPKGVVITHQNIMANVEYLSLTSSGNKDDIFVNWLPLFHDLGLVTAILWPVFLGTCSVLMSPATFVTNPVSWLKAISLYRGSMCGGPNFAYDLCINTITDEEVSSLDLSSWRCAYNAAEPIKAKTLKNFMDKFSACGFKNNSFYPCYGMAEATVCVSGGIVSEPPKILYVDKKKLAGHQLELIEEDNALSTAIVGCGVAYAPHYLKVVNPDAKTESKEGEVGEIWFAGPSVSLGYWQLGDVSKETFGQSIAGETDHANQYLRTGDYGVMWESELYVTGRMKDLIILNGVNYYPQDIEESTVKSHEAVRAGYNAAFSVDEGGSEKLVVVTELERRFFRKVDPESIIYAIRKQIFDDHQVDIDRVVLLKPYVIPTTSSGKIQRNQTKTLLSNGEFDVFADSNEFPKQGVVKPETKVEHVIHEIWCTILKQVNVSTTDNFFDIGGDSIAAIQISAAIEKAYQTITIDMEQLLALATIKDISQLIELAILQQEKRSIEPSSKSRMTFKI